MKIQEGRVAIQEGVVIGKGGNKELLADIFSAILMAQGISSARGRTRFIRPMRAASVASINSPAKISSMA